MDPTLFTVAGLILCSFISRGQSVNLVNADDTSTHFAGAQSLVMWCNATDDFEIWEHTLLWKKMHKSLTSSGELKDYEINTKKLVRAPFVKTGRFAVDMFKPPHPAISLTITHLKTEDHGVYVCQLTGSNGLIDEVKYNVIIKAPIANLIFSASQQTEAGDGEPQFQFDDVSPSNVTCQAMGGFPDPVLTVHLESKDVTKDFKDVERDDRTTGDPGLEKTQFNVTLTAVNFQPSSHYHGKYITCRGQILSDPQLTVERRALVDVRFAPVFDQCQTSLDADVGEKDFKIQCTVKANPPVDGSTVRWTVGGEDSGIVLSEADSYDDGLTTFNSISTKPGDSTSVRIFELHISTVNSSSFQTYTLFVSNAIADRQHVVNLYPKTTTQTPATTRKRVVNNAYQIPLSSTERLHFALPSLLSALAVALFS